MKRRTPADNYFLCSSRPKTV